MENVLKDPTPCVNGEFIKRYVGKFVVVYGKISSIKKDTIYLNMNPSKINFFKFQANDDSQIMVKNCNYTDELSEGSIVKIQGKVMQDFSLEAIQVFPVDDGFDLKTYNDSLRIMHHDEFKDMFFN